MDSVYHYNKARWETLVKAKALFSRPWLNETQESARQRLDPQGRLGRLAGRDVLCLAGGGGQQAVAFALQGAQVTMFDLSEGQLERDREAARHYGYLPTPMEYLQRLDRILSRPYFNFAVDFHHHEPRVRLLDASDHLPEFFHWHFFQHREESW